MAAANFNAPALRFSVPESILDFLFGMGATDHQ
jgi:hypothetical protein